MTALPRKVSCSMMDAEFQVLFHGLLQNIIIGPTDLARCHFCNGIADLLAAETIANEVLKDLNDERQKNRSGGPEVRTGPESAASTDAAATDAQLHDAGVPVTS